MSSCKTDSVVALFDDKIRSRCEDFSTLVDYFRSRVTPVYLFGDADIDQFNDELITQEADAVCDNRLYGYSLGRAIDWYANPTPLDLHDLEWGWSLHRHTHWVTLARAYRCTGDERYAQEFVRQLVSWYTAKEDAGSRARSEPAQHGCFCIDRHQIYRQYAANVYKKSQKA